MHRNFSSSLSQGHVTTLVVYAEDGVIVIPNVTSVNVEHGVLHYQGKTVRPGSGVYVKDWKSAECTVWQSWAHVPREILGYIYQSDIDDEIRKGMDASDELRPN